MIALWHKPRYSSGATQYQAVQPLWDDLYAAGVDILLDGHDHIYERTAPMKSGATLASPPVADPTYGIRQFTVGTGGEGHHGLVTPLPTSQVRDDTTFGIFKLTLHANTYDWVFLPIAWQHLHRLGHAVGARRSAPAGVERLAVWRLVDCRAVDRVPERPIPTDDAGRRQPRRVQRLQASSGRRGRTRRGARGHAGRRQLRRLQRLEHSALGERHEREPRRVRRRWAMPVSSGSHPTGGTTLWAPGRLISGNAYSRGQSLDSAGRHATA